jgi:predicted RecB family endonuclease
VLRASESVAASHLESMGFRVLEFHRKVVVDGVEVSDIDIVAEKNNIVYAVEVKAGLADVSSMRQAYVNSVLTGMRPAIVARGYSDEAARAVASRLGIEVIILDDQLFVQPDELRELIVDAVEEALERVTLPLSFCGSLGEEDLRAVRAIASAEDFSSAAKLLGVTAEQLGRLVESMRRRGVMPRGDFRAMRVASRLLLLCSS